MCELLHLEVVVAEGALESAGATCGDDISINTNSPDDHRVARHTRAQSSAPFYFFSMTDLQSKFFVATTVLLETTSGFEESRLETAPAPPSTDALPRTQSLFDDLQTQRGAADAALSERFKHKPPRTIDEDDALFMNQRHEEEQSTADRNRAQADADRQEFQMLLASRSIKQSTVDEPVDLATAADASAPPAFGDTSANGNGGGGGGSGGASGGGSGSQQAAILARMRVAKSSGKPTHASSKPAAAPGQKRALPPSDSVTVSASTTSSAADSTSKKAKSATSALALLGSYSDDDEDDT